MKFFNKLKNKNKGFTLIELIVSLGILAVLSGVLIPSLIVSMNDAKAKNDNATLGHLTELHQAAVQEHETYHYFAQTVDKLADGQKSVYFWYESDEEGNVTFKAMNLAYPAGATQAQKDEINHIAGQLKVKVCDYINGTYEIPQMESRSNKSNTYIVCISATNREFLVRAQGYWFNKDE